MLVLISCKLKPNSSKQYHCWLIKVKESCSQRSEGITVAKKNIPVKHSPHCVNIRCKKYAWTHTNTATALSLVHIPVKQAVNQTASKPEI